MNRDLTPAQAERITLSIHGAGHAVVGTIYGATIEGASITDEGNEGLCSFAAEAFGPSAHAYRSHIAAAGAVAAAMFRHGRRPALHQIDEHLHGSDRDELRAAAFSSMQPMSAPLLAVRPLVQRCSAAIVELATHMYFGQEIGHDDVCNALGLSDDGGQCSVQLAMIRNGGTPRTFNGDTRPR